VWVGGAVTIEATLTVTSESPTHSSPARAALQLQRYRSRVSEPLLYRIDLCVQARAVSYRELAVQGAFGSGTGSQLLLRHLGGRTVDPQQ
jgi:predicted ATPase with chaperone activity